MIVVFDMVGTLTTGSPVRGLVRWVRQHQSKARANLYMVSIMPSYARAKLGLLDWQKWGQRLMLSALPLIRDADQETIRHMAEWSVEHELWPRRREDVLARLRSHVEEGAQVYIASSVFEPTVKAFAARAGAKAIGTPLAISGGRVRFAADSFAGDRKLEQVRARLGVQRLDAAYGDTWADIPMLQSADRPVAVYPDDELRAAALEAGWEIIGNRE